MSKIYVLTRGFVRLVTLFLLSFLFFSSLLYNILYFLFVVVWVSIGVLWFPSGGFVVVSSVSA